MVLDCMEYILANELVGKQIGRQTIAAKAGKQPILNNRWANIKYSCIEYSTSTIQYVLTYYMYDDTTYAYRVL